ncbi:MAG: nickel pincer cofactor biosynthesis protein LarB [Terriglobales bacterium]
MSAPPRPPQTGQPVRLEDILAAVAAGGLTPAQAAERLRYWPFEDLGFARVDHHRGLRQGMAEVILAAGKTAAQVAAIAVAIARHAPTVLITRADAACYRAVRRRLPAARYHPLSRVITLQPVRRRPERGAAAVADGVLVLAAGTSDIPVAEEAVLTAEAMGSRVRAIYDVGVAGLHRLLAERQALAQARAIVVVAGMEGALPSVVGGLVAAPVIAVPTSVGYGASLGGLAALLGMLNSCASNVTVVNINNGFGAGYVASLICRGR